jgi:hypothetical protein
MARRGFTKGLRTNFVNQSGGAELGARSDALRLDLYSPGREIKRSMPTDGIWSTGSIREFKLIKWTNNYLNEMPMKL